MHDARVFDGYSLIMTWVHSFPPGETRGIHMVTARSPRDLNRIPLVSYPRVMPGRFLTEKLGSVISIDMYRIPEYSLR